jgi:predicted membrane protein
MTSSNAVRITPRLIIGLGILALGLLWTLDNMNVIESEAITRWWPLILVAVGAARLLDPYAGKTASVVLIGVGTLLLLDIAHLIDFDLGDLVPLAIAVLGGKLVWDSLGRRGARRSLADSSSLVHVFAFMSGVHRQASSPTFRGGDASAIMGGVELDLRGASVADGENVIIDAFAWWGGVEIKVPGNWRVDGSAASRTRPAHRAPPDRC